MTSTAPPASALSVSLTDVERQRFRDQGYLGPYAATTPEEMAEIRRQIETDVLTTPGLGKNPRQSRHMDSAVVYDLATRPAIVERMASLYGPDLILWATNFFNKEPGGQEIPWHQDLNYWPIEPLINISAWIAIDRVTVENSAVHVIPGSHKKVVPHIAADSTKAFQEEADPTFFDASQAVPIELEPGEFFLFNEKTLHYSKPNTSNLRRMGMSVRVTLPIVKIDHDIPPLHEGHTASLIRGTDTMGLNRLAGRPADH